MNLWEYDIEDLAGERKDVRKNRFREIGEDVYSFFLDTATKAGFQEREGQWEMSCEIVDGIRDNKHVLVEAGVGIGKSFAYIVPILYYNKIYCRPVVIATSTIALQEQLIHDIEKIMDLLNYDTEVLTAKGQNHFLCKKRFNEYFNLEFIQENSEYKEIYNAIGKSGYEKADWNIFIPDELWSKINVREYNPQTCKDKCSYCSYCHYYNLRQQMLHTRGVIVCNQDLLAVHMSRKAYFRKLLMNEAIGLIVIDEAHNLESKVRSSITSCLSVRMLKGALKGVRSIVDSYYLNDIEKADRLIDGFFRNLSRQMDYQDKESAKNGQDIDRYFVKDISDKCIALKNVLDSISFNASLYFGDYVGNHNRKNRDEDIEQLEDAVGFLESMIARDESEDIFWIERNRGIRGIKGIQLYRCPKEVNKIAHQILFSDSNLPVVLTSATITSGQNEDYVQNYSYFINNTGLPINQSLICEPKESPFNYDEHAMIYYTENMPHPTRDRARFIKEGVREIIKLLHISKGKALILFTAKTDMQEVYDRLCAENLPFEIIMQRGNSKQAETLGKFRNDTNSVLLGTGSYWEGINIEGVSLSHVIIFKLPFPVREPVVDYKLKRCNNNGLMEVLVPEMVIRLKQGIGRLIRSEHDKGIISIIDSRVGEKSKAPYKDIIWKSLPIKNKTNKISKIAEFYNDIVESKEDVKNLKMHTTES